MEELNDFIEVGKITKKIKEESKKLIIPGQPLEDIAETIEQMILDEGLGLAFPCNISINEVAAHDTPKTNDPRELTENDVVKIDFGATLNRAISDTAYTIDLTGKYEKLVKASEAGFKRAVEIIKPGIKISEVGEVIEKEIKSYGFKPISNLTGHMIKRGLLHAGIDVPNVKNNIQYEFKEGDIFAIEPFATTGSGVVADTDEVEIFSLNVPKPVRSRQARNILEYIIKEKEFLPFSIRELNKVFKSRLLVASALREMIESKILIAYPVLKDTGKGIVSQYENTILITEKGNKILT